MTSAVTLSVPGWLIPLPEVGGPSFVDPLRLGGVDGEGERHRTILNHLKFLLTSLPEHLLSSKNLSSANRTLQNQVI
jgi:hypothetical protein